MESDASMRLLKPTRSTSVWTVALTVISLFPLDSGFVGQESPTTPPVQPPEEVRIASEFEAAAPTLFNDWKIRRPEVLRAVGLGMQGKELSTCNTMFGHTWFYTFIVCQDSSPPATYSIDVKKTDSILTPYLGMLAIPVSETCDVKNVVPAKASWTKKNFEKHAPACIGKTYAECIAHGASDAPGFVGSACTGGAGFSFSYTGVQRVYYRWSKGKWEFQREEQDPPRNIPTQRAEFVDHDFLKTAELRH